MKVLVLGSGGRESALAWALQRSSSVSEVVSAPGNPGIAGFAETLALNPEDLDGVRAAARRMRPDLVVVGPEAPLVAGVADGLRRDGLRVFGPDAAAARIEGSKSYAKELMDRAGIATGRWGSFEFMADAVSYMDELGPPYVIKADGLAAGKGVVVTDDRSTAVGAIEDSLVHKRFGDAGGRLVVEEFLDGQEASVIAFVDGHRAVACEVAQDYKRAYDGDEGPNTGGMGSYSPVPACPNDVAAQIATEIIEPMVAATAATGAPFVGALYAGLALTSTGPRVVEFNARFGDPETQALLPRLRSDFGEVCTAAASGELEGMALDWTPDVCVTVVLASGGYPGPYEVGVPISGLDAAAPLDSVEIFHAGTTRQGGEVVTAGGRVLTVSALGKDFEAARTRVYEAANRISFAGRHLRTDIGLRAEEAQRAQGG